MVSSTPLVYSWLESLIDGQLSFDHFWIWDPRPTEHRHLSKVTRPMKGSRKLAIWLSRRTQTREVEGSEMVPGPGIQFLAAGCEKWGSIWLFNVAHWKITPFLIGKSGKSSYINFIHQWARRGPCRSVPVWSRTCALALVLSNRFSKLPWTGGRRCDVLQLRVITGLFEPIPTIAIWFFYGWAKWRPTIFLYFFPMFRQSRIFWEWMMGGWGLSLLLWLDIQSFCLSVPIWEDENYSQAVGFFPRFPVFF